MMGASFVHPDKLFVGVFGDLAFFYDMNVVGNRHVGNNVRIMLINNGKGNEFRNYRHPCAFLGEEADEFVAAAGHYGNKSHKLVKDYATDLGYEYLSASNKEEFLAVIDKFYYQIKQTVLYCLKSSQRRMMKAMLWKCFAMLFLIQNILPKSN